MFIISFLSKVQVLVLGVKKAFFAVYVDTPWIHILLRIRIQEAKILRIQRL